MNTMRACLLLSLATVMPALLVNAADPIEGTPTKKPNTLNGGTNAVDQAIDQSLKKVQDALKLPMADLNDARKPNELLLLRYFLRQPFRGGLA